MTISPSFSLYKMVVFPAASSPTISILISFFPKRLLNKLAIPPIVTLFFQENKQLSTTSNSNNLFPSLGYKGLASWPRSVESQSGASKMNTQITQRHMCRARLLWSFLSPEGVVLRHLGTFWSLLHTPFKVINYF